MAAPNMIITQQDHARFADVLNDIAQQANAKLVFLLDKAGQQIAQSGEMQDVDPTSLASLTAGNVAATEGVAELVGENSFTTLFHEGENESLHITVVGGRIILLVIFDQRSSVGLVRLRVEQHKGTLEGHVIDLLHRVESGDDSGASVDLGEITEADIDALFG